MSLRSSTQTLADLRLIVEKLQQNRQSYDGVAFSELTAILYRRINELVRSLQRREFHEDDPARWPPESMYMK